MHFFTLDENVFFTRSILFKQNLIMIVKASFSFFLKKKT